MCPHIPLNSLHPHGPSSLYCSFNHVFLLSTVFLFPFPHAALALLQGCAAKPWAAVLGWRWGWEQGTPRIWQEELWHSASFPLWGSRDFHAWTSVGKELNRKKGQSCIMSPSEVVWFAEQAVCTTGRKPCWEECLTSDLQSLIPWRPALILFTFSAFHFLLSVPVYGFVQLYSTFLPFPSVWLLHSNQCS